MVDEVPQLVCLLSLDESNIRAKRRLKDVFLAVDNPFLPSFLDNSIDTDRAVETTQPGGTSMESFHVNTVRGCLYLKLSAPDPFAKEILFT